MLPLLDSTPKLPPSKMPDAYTLVLDLDETLVHYSEHDGMGSYEIRPGMYEFLQHMSHAGYEIVIFTAATQDYADWVIDQIDPDRLIVHRLYRQHALPWGPIFVKDLSRIGRDLDRVIIIDNVQENFMLQPHNGIFILSWYDDPNDTALFALTPLLDEVVRERPRVHQILEKYRHDIPSWAGFENYDQVGSDLPEYDTAALDERGYFDHPPNGGFTQPAQEMPAPMSAAGSYSQAPQEQSAPCREAGQACQAPMQQQQQHVPGLQQATIEAHQRQQGTASFSPPPYQSEVSTQQTYSYHPQSLPSSYPSRQPAAGYPPQAAEHPPQHEAPPQQQLRAAHVAQVQQHHLSAAPQPQVVQRRPAPAFSGVAGPYQAAQPMQQGQPAAMWGRAGTGPCQAPRR